MPLDDYVAEHNLQQIDLIKIDVEAAEPLVLAGMESVLYRQDAPNLICEINPFLLNEIGQDSRAITRKLAAAGYQLYLIEPFSLTSYNPETIMKPPHQDIFCTKT